MYIHIFCLCNACGISYEVRCFTASAFVVRQLLLRCMRVSCIRHSRRYMHSIALHTHTHTHACYMLMLLADSLIIESIAVALLLL